MNASEALLAELLELDGWSCHPGYRVTITREEKIAIGQHTLPSPELDVLALKHGRVLWVESKTYLDSAGVRAETLTKGYVGPGRVRVFNDAPFRTVVTSALLRQLKRNGAVAPDASKVEYGFAAWKFKNDLARLDTRKLFDQHGWLLFDHDWLVQHLEALARTSYRDSTAALVAKLLLRTSRPAPPE
jgi:hypothetical protein